MPCLIPGIPRKPVLNAVQWSNSSAAATAPPPPQVSSVCPGEEPDAATDVSPPCTEESAADPATCSIVAGRQTTIEINREQMGLGLSVVGGSDTLLVGGHFSPLQSHIAAWA